MYVAARRHGDLARLKRKELASPKSHAFIVDSVTEYGPCKGYFTGS